MKRTLAMAAAVLAAAAALTGCTAGGDGEGAEQHLAMSLNTDPATFDPALARSGDDYTVVRFLFDTLLRRDADNTLVGGLASSWETVDAANYVLTVNGEATCGDGTALTATMVADSLARFADPETGSTGRARAFGAATATFTPDDAEGTVAVQLSEGWSDFLVGLTLPQASIVCPDGLADLEGLNTGAVASAFTGPYLLTSSTPAVSYEFALRDDYATWPVFAQPLGGRPASSLTLRPITDYTTIATQLISGELDAGVVSDENVDRFEGAAGFDVVDSVNTTTYLQFNVRPGTIFGDDPALRTAVAQVVDSAAFADIVTDGRGEALLSLSDSNVQCVNTDASLIPTLDSDAAAKVLDGVSIRVVGTTLLDSGNEYVAEVLRKAGADVTLESLDNANWSTRTAGVDWDLNIQGDQNLMGTMTTSLQRVLGPSTEEGGLNKTGSKNAAGYAALLAAMGTNDSAEKCAELKVAEASYLDAVDALPLSTIPTSNVFREGVEIRVVDGTLDVATLRFSD